MNIQATAVGKNHPAYAQSLMALATLYTKMGAVDRAEPLFHQALKIQEAIFGKESPQYAESLNLLAEFYFRTKDFAKAEPAFIQSRTIVQRVFGPESLNFAASTQNLAELYTHIGKLDEAESLFLIALPIFENGMQHWYAECASNLGELYARKGQFDKAEEFYLKSERIFEKMLGKENVSTAKTMLGIGTLYQRMGQFDKATQWFQDYRVSVRQHTAQVLPGLGSDLQIEYLQNEFRPGFIDSLALGFQRRDNARARILSAGWLINGKGVGQEVMAEGALLTSSEAAPLVTELRSVRNELAKITLRLESDPNKRRQQIEQVADLESRQQDLARKIAAFSSGHRQGNPWVSAGELREALPLGSTLVNIARLDVNRTFGGDNASDAEAKAADAEHYVAWIIPPVGEREIQIVDLGLAKEIDESVSKVRQGIGDAPKRIFEVGEKDAWNEFKPAIAELSRQIAAPLLEHLADSTQLIMSPDSNLWLVPWNALLDNDGKFLTERFELRYVLSGRELVEQSSERALIGPPVIFADPDYDLGSDAAPASDAHNDASNNQRSGGADGRGTLGTFGRLFGTAKEAQQVLPSLEEYTGEKATLLTQKAALESTLKQLHRPRVLVVSTHGFFLKDQCAAESNNETAYDQTRSSVLTADGKLFENPLLRCGLALAGCNHRNSSTVSASDDGILTGLEIVGTDLRGTEIVVLSACETGVGQTNNGEGVAGLRQAFQLAGADAVIASLWQVPDDDTATLMSLFWKNMAAGKTKSQSMREAQLAVISNHRHAESAVAHPYFWAAFTLTGR